MKILTGTVEKVLSKTVKKPGHSKTRLNLTEKNFILGSKRKTNDSGQIEIASHLDYLKMTGEGIEKQDYECLVKYLFSDRDMEEIGEKEGVSKEDNQYPGRIKHITGARILHGRNAETGLVKVVIELTGSYLERLNVISQWRLLRGLKEFGLKCSRFDVAVDDYEKKISLEKIYQAAQSKQLARMRRFGRYEGGQYKNDEVVSSGTTVTLGSRESQAYVRIYETKYKHEYDAIRWEVEFKKSKAKIAFECFVGNGRVEGESDEQLAVRLQQELASMAIGCVDFVDRDSGHSNGTISSCKRIEWWQKFIDRVSKHPYRIKPVNPKPMEEKNMNWIRHSTSKSWLRKFLWIADCDKWKEGREIIESMRDVLGLEGVNPGVQKIARCIEFLVSIFDDASKRMTKLDYALVDELRGKKDLALGY